MAEHNASAAASGVFGHRELNTRRSQFLPPPGPEYRTVTAPPISPTNDSSVLADSISRSTLRNPAGRLVFIADEGQGHSRWSASIACSDLLNFRVIQV